MNYIREAINRLGSSFYYYDLDGFKAHMSEIKRTLKPDFKVWYACKANPLSEILKILHEVGFGADVASLGELHQATLQGYEGEDLIATGPAKSKNYLATLLKSEVSCIVIESLNQLKDLNDLCQKLSLKKDVLLRIQLEWEGEASILGGSSITPFGLGLSDWRKIDLTPYQSVNILGLHCFQWGNIVELKQLEKIWEFTLKEARAFSNEKGIDLKVMDLGGGLGISYHNDKVLKFSDVQDVLVKLKKAYEIPEIWLELGRYSIANYGSYLTKIVDIKEVRGKNIIVTEGGINHLARPALVKEAFPCEAFEVTSDECDSFAVHGPLCTALDFLGEFKLPKTLKVGDWLKFNKAGAYGLTESMPYFLCHQLVGEVAKFNGDLIIPRAPKGHLDWTV
jgi:diaminopimelate decarboxylase